MTRIAEVMAEGPTVSFELCPPKTPEGRTQLDACIADLSALSPSFVSVTYGAGGGGRETTRDLVIELDAATPYPAMPHITCIGHTSAELGQLLDEYAAGGIENVLALAGDPPADGTDAGGDFTYASQLVQMVRSTGSFSIGVAAFPEGHPRSASLAADRQNLAAKLELADFGITQFFFRVEDYFRMIEDLDRLGCSKPVLPGIMPMLNPDAVRRFAAMNGAYFPEELADAVASASPADRLSIAAEAAREVVGELERHGVPGIHVYCLTRADAALAVLGD